MAARRIVDRLAARVLGGGDASAAAGAPPLERRAREALGPATRAFVDDEPSVGEWLRGLVPTGAGARGDAAELFPAASWLQRYNLRWLAGDLIAGVTIGLVVVPQALAYASLAHLPPAYGLYTSFTGAALYWVFGTSKDVVIGTTAVGSLLVGQVVTRVEDASPGVYAPEETARALSLMAGAVLLVFGLFRLGWIIEFVPYIPISAFVTAASITIMSTQVPVALGIAGVDTRQPPYLVMLQTLRRLGAIRLDAAIGLSAIGLLFAVRALCSAMEARRPAQRRAWAYASSLRLTLTMLLFTLVSYLVHRDTPLADARFRIVGHIDRGFKQAAVPRPEPALLRALLPELPAVAVILAIEHIAIAKAMGRLFGYTVNPSQETAALGAANLLSPLVGGYVCTGSFGASAVLSKAGARSPLAGLFSAAVLVLALYALTSVFYFIPNAALAGLIIHAVCNLVISPAKLYGYWRLSPPELVIWVVSVAFAMFVSLEASICAGVALSSALLLVRIARTRGVFLGRVRVRRVVGAANADDDDDDDDDDEKDKKDDKARGLGDGIGDGNVDDDDDHDNDDDDGLGSSRDVFLPLHRGDDASNPALKVASPYPGIFVYRLNEGYNYTNQAYHVDTLTRHIVGSTRPGSEELLEKESDRLWNEAGPRAGKGGSGTKTLPPLRAVVLDLAAVHSVDITSVQGLVDLRYSLDRHAAPDAVEWHLAGVHNRWTRRALAAAGFGRPPERRRGGPRWRPIYSIAEVAEPEPADGRGGAGTGAGAGADEESTCGSRTSVGSASGSVAEDKGRDGGGGRAAGGWASVTAVDRPFFHVDLHEAVASAVRDGRGGV